MNQIFDAQQQRELANAKGLIANLRDEVTALSTSIENEIPAQVKQAKKTAEDQIKQIQAAAEAQIKNVKLELDHTLTTLDQQKERAAQELREKEKELKRQEDDVRNLLPK